MATTLLSLDQKLLETLGYWRYRHPVTTALAASTSLVSTHLQKHRSTADHFNDWWVSIEDEANIGEERLVSNDDGTSTLTVLSAWTAEAASEKANFRLCPYKWGNRKRAIIEAIKEVYPNLFLPLDDRTLITGNILPNSHFEDWASSSYPDFYSVTSATAAQTTTAGLYRGQRGTSSALVTASAADGYMSITSKDYPRLLDLMDKDIDFKCWAYPSVADDAFLTIYTIQADGTEQTLNSTTTCPASKWTLLELEDQDINDDIVEIQLRFRVHTKDATCYFDAARVTGRDIREYLLPDDFYNGSLLKVYIQTSGYSDDACDDILPRYWERVFGYDIIDDGTYKYLYLPYLYGAERQIRLIGNKPLEDLTGTTEAAALALTISLDGQRLNILTEYAAYYLLTIESAEVSSEDRSHTEQQAAKHYYKYQTLKATHGMPRPSGTMKVRVL